MQEAARSAPHSRLLSKGSSIYEVVTDEVGPKHWDEYLKSVAVFLSLSFPGILLLSFFLQAQG